MQRSRYVIINQDGEWRIRQAGRHFSTPFPSKVEALCAAIQLAEKDGEQGQYAEVLVRQEDEHFTIEWVYGDPWPTEYSSAPR
jgi:hypothetical protein